VKVYFAFDHGAGSTRTGAILVVRDFELAGCAAVVLLSQGRIFGFGLLVLGWVIDLE